MSNILGLVELVGLIVVIVVLGFVIGYSNAKSTIIETCINNSIYTTETVKLECKVYE